MKKTIVLMLSAILTTQLISTIPTHAATKNNESVLFEENINARSSIPSTMEVPRGASNALVIKYLRAPRYGQQTDTYYLSPENAKLFAYKLTSSSSSETIAGYLAGLLTSAVTTSFWAGAIFPGGQMIASLRKDSVSDKILKYANNGEYVKINVTKSMDSTFYSVNKWNGKTVDTSRMSKDNILESLACVKFN